MNDSSNVLAHKKGVKSKYGYTATHIGVLCPLRENLQGHYSLVNDKLITQKPLIYEGHGRLDVNNATVGLWSASH